jgi:[acyl-carrier-protein] S-malonyltransferase/trans-AT polyketide synthase/acyltransferase/oxidoreductase domain-containing protein
MNVERANGVPRSIALVFPGQGSQRIGMVRDFYDAFAVARSTFAEASDALGLELESICFDEGDGRLDQTEFTQPALLTAEIAVARVLKSDFGVLAGHFGGHSLGEYAALTAAGVIPLPHAVRIVRQRGALMQKAVPAGAGAMIAVIAENIGSIDRREWSRPWAMSLANHNSPDQVVFSGRASAVSDGSAALGAHLAGREHRIVPLNVSAPFHSSLMRVVHAPFRRVLEEVASEFEASRAAVVTSNFTGGFHVPGGAALINALVCQTSATLEWVANMKRLSSVADRICEVGPGATLRGFFKSMGQTIVSINSVRAAVREFS